MEHFVYGVIATLAWASFIYLNDAEGRMCCLAFAGFVIYALLMGCTAHYLFGFEDFGICLFIFGPLWAWTIGCIVWSKIHRTHCPHRQHGKLLYLIQGGFK